MVNHFMKTETKKKKHLLESVHKGREEEGQGSNNKVKTMKITTKTPSITSNCFSELQIIHLTHNL